MITTNSENQSNRTKLLIWWIVWGAVLLGLTLLYFILGRGQPVPQELPPEKLLTGLVGFVPLFVSIVIRWLVLPRYKDINRAFVMFIIGISLAEACGILGLLLGGPYRDDFFVLGLMGIIQFVPIFAKGYLEPKSSGFIPNN